jgi:organic radical activating enzyme
MEVSLEQVIDHLSEVFYSIQGEGKFMGLPTLFFRFNRCNLDCMYCDTDFESGNIKANTEDFVEKIKLFMKNYPIKQICFTGGEPLLFIDDMIQIIKVLNKPTDVKIETNGTILPEVRIFYSHLTYFTITPKLEYSGLYESTMSYWLGLRDKVSYKFMIDPYKVNFPIVLNMIYNFIMKYEIYRVGSNIYLSPINRDNSPEKVLETYKELVRQCVKHKDNRFFTTKFTGISLQLHKLLEFK